MEAGSIAEEVLARYAADAARSVPGVLGVAEGPLPGRHGVRVRDGRDGDDSVHVELRLRVADGVLVPQVAETVQAHVRDYLRATADVEDATVDVVVAGIGS